MRTAAFVAALVAGVAAAPQAVTSAIAPKETTPAGCKADYNGKFQVTVNPVGGAKKIKRDSVPLEITLKGGVMTDAQGRTGYIASNNQFQFDGPAQAGAIYTAGWSVCANNSLALGDSAIFYQCLSGTFYNLYDENTAAQCSPVYLEALGSAASPANNAAATNTIVCQIGDGQIQQNTCVTTATRVAEATDGQLTAVKATITQIGDGQIQAPGPSSAASSVITSAPKPQTPAVQPPKITQISDGQIQAPTGGNSTVATRTPTPVNNAPASSASGTSPAASTFTGAASVARVEMFGLVAGLVALVAL